MTGILNNHYGFSIVKCSRLVLSAYAVYVEIEHGHGASVPIQILLEMTASDQERADIESLFPEFKEKAEAGKEKAELNATDNPGDGQ